MRHILFLCFVFGFMMDIKAESRPLYRDADAAIEERVTDLLGRLTLEEKVFLCHGNFISGGVPRLKIDPLLMLDGRQGVRKKGTPTTLMPCVLSLSCTWDPKAAEDFGRVLAEEMLAFDRHVLLAPMLNLVRSPLGGRNFENFGEDPYLAGVMGSAYIQGVQKQQVGACACLLVANDCERFRHYTSSNMDERTLREMHIVSYEMSVRDGRVWSMMSGNNIFNGTYCAENRYLIQELVKDTFGFDGVMITDWRAAYNTLPTALAGTDITTGGCKYVFGDKNLLSAVKSGKVSASLLEDKVRRILRLYFRSGVIDKDARPEGGVDTPEHRQTARRLAAEGMVLLKNEPKLLPLDASKIKRILLTGPASDKVLQGGGSGNVQGAIKISALDGLKEAFEGKAKIQHVPFDEALQFSAEKAARVNGMPWQAAYKTVDIPKLVQAAKTANAVVFVAAGVISCENHDLLDMNLPGRQDEAITALAKANPNIVVVLVNNGAVSIQSWSDQVPSILAVHYSGEVGGQALADVLTGTVNPGGKLSYTFARQLKDYPAHALGEWPAKLILDKAPPAPGWSPEERKPTHAYDTEYNEGVFTGYRWFDEKKTEPVFPFGHGLSYTTFEMSDLKVSDKDGYHVSCTVKNTGDCAGSEVVQVYIAPAKASVPRPVRELKGFKKITLDAGKSATVDIPLRPAALAFYDVESKRWKAEAGEYEILVGSSSRDIQLRSAITLPEDTFFDHY